MRKLVALLTLALLMLGLVVPAAAQEEEAPEGTGYIRIAQFSPAQPRVIVFLNSEVALSGLPFGRVSAWREVPAGTHSVALGSTSGNIENAFLGPIEIEVAAGSFTTYALVASDDPNTADVNEYKFRAIDETAQYTLAATPGAANVTIFHAIEGAPIIDIWALPTPAEAPAEGEAAPVPAIDGARIVTALAFPETFFTPQGPLNDGYFTQAIPAGTYDIQAVPNEFREPAIIDVQGFELEAGQNYLIAAIGTPDTPDLAVVSGPADEFVTAGIVDLAVGTGDLSTLVAALQAADPAILEALGGTGPFTVFAPTNDAFAALLEALNVSAEDLLGNTELLNTVLRYHVVGAAGGGAIHSSELVTRGQILTLSNEFISAEGTVLNGSVNVISADIPATNGIVHVIDGVLLPPSVVAALAAAEATEGE
jgi:uncharacterized surface protein with fasciclin (FAS1) repeats